MSLSLDTARTILRSILDEGARRGLKPLSVCIVDAGGHTIAFERSDGASPMRFGIAHGKANGAVMLGMGSRALFERAKAEPFFIQSVNALAGGALVPVPGGVLIRDNGAIVGAVGVTGDTSDNDEACAIAAIEASGLTPDAGG